MSHASPYLRPTLCIAIIVCALVACATLLSRPAEVWVSLDARCESLQMPVAADWDLAPPRDLSAFWMEAVVRNLEGPSREWKLAADSTVPSAPPSIRLLPGDRATRLKFHSEAGTRLAVGQRLEWHHSPSGSWSAEISFFDATLEAANVAAKRTFEASIRNNLLPATLTISSRPAPGPQFPAYLSVPKPESLAWSAPPAALSKPVSLAASACRVSSLRSDAVNVAPSSGQIENLRVDWLSPSTLALAVDHSDGLRVQAAGVARSVREGGRELLPTLFEQLARGAPERRGLFGVSLAILVMAAGIYLKRALEILAKLHLPDPE